MYNPIKEVKIFWREVPSQVQVFLIRALFIFLVWKFAYHLYFKPERILDKPLTTFVAKHTKLVLEKIYPTNVFTQINMLPKNNVDFFIVNINLNGKKALGISDACNALELITLYIGFLLAMFTNLRRVFYFGILGVVGIYVCNVIRCTTIGFLNIQRSWTTEIAHHYVFKLIMYFLIFLVWVWYMKGEEENG